MRDEAATERLRAQALAGVRSVYDFDEGALEEAASRIRASFREARPPAERKGARRQDRAQREVDRAQREAERTRFEARLGATVTWEDFSALHAARFSPEVEEALVALAARALSGMVVEEGSPTSATSRRASWPPCNSSTASRRMTR